MSYILDALRKADAERERGSVPGLRAQPVAPVSVDAAPRAMPRSMLWALGGVSLVLLAALAWRGGFVIVPRAAEPVDARPAQTLNIEAEIGTPKAPPPQAPPRAKPGPVAVADASAPEVTRTARVAPAPSPAARGPAATAPDPAAAFAPPAASAEPGPPGAPATSRVVGAAPPQSSASSAVLGLADLPEGIRRELPTLAFGGSIYSEQPANRFVIINGQTFRERDQVTPGLVIEQIQLRGAVLGYKGYRYRVAF